MTKPYLLIVTGRPGSGKSTLAHVLGEQFLLPVISRDQIKEGYLQTLGVSHHQMQGDPNKHATEAFFAAIRSLVQNGISIIAEAAFQHHVWTGRLSQLLDLARIYILICTVDDVIAMQRVKQRGLAQPQRMYFHGDGYDAITETEPLTVVNTYQAPRINVPTIWIDTTSSYNPSLATLQTMIFG